MKIVPIDSGTGYNSVTAPHSVFTVTNLNQNRIFCVHAKTLLSCIIQVQGSYLKKRRFFTHHPLKLFILFFSLLIIIKFAYVINFPSQICVKKYLCYVECSPKYAPNISAIIWNGKKIAYLYNGSKVFVAAIPDQIFDWSKWSFNPAINGLNWTQAFGVG